MHWFNDKCPAGFVPEGWTPPASQGNKLNQNDKDWKGMLASPIFYVMILVLLCGAFYGLMCSALASPLAQGMIGMSVAAATTVVSVLALFNTGGRIIAGYVSDKIGRNNTLAVAFIFAIIGLICLYFSGKGDITRFYIGIITVGVSFGAFMGVFPGFTADQFGTKHNSVNYGIMFIGFAISGYFGPTVMKNVYAADHRYQRAFLIAAILCVIGFALTFVYRFITKKENNKIYDLKSA
ncbi:MFS transporter [Clostridium thailandense]|uniref:MFS transporter n=1 Tax=Clostridium thailandense TaxID=2794346 RepID=UPI00398A395B